MKYKYWRDIMEVISVIAIVAGLVLVAAEVRQANHIARTEVALSLSAQYNAFNSARFQDPEVARLALKLMDPDQDKYDETEASMMAGAAWHFGNIFGSAQTAYENGLIELADLDKYRSDLEWMMEYMPGLRDEFILIYRTVPTVQDMYVYEPVRTLLTNEETK
jgi:hypothetical protein